MLTALIAIGGIGLVAGLGLAVASKIFYVYVNPTIVAVEDALPGANCGGCGYPGCSGAAVAIARGTAAPNICVAGGTETHINVGEIMGVAFVETEPEIAVPGCYYGLEKADLKFHYDGINDCRAAMLLGGGSKACPIGCLGLGTCQKACPFGAITMGSDSLPVVNKNLCTGCGTCERVCPKNIITLTSNSRRIQNEYTTEVCTAPCQRECPSGINIPAYINQIAIGNYTEAVRIIKETNPFPLVCGRICVQPCELECRRNLVDEPVAINNLKRFAADYEMNSGQRIQIAQAPKSDKRIAVVGGGAEGLTAAYFLNRLGHEIKVFESKSELGGLLRTGLPESRLPRQVLDWEIDGIKDAGVEVATKQKLGRDFTIGSLLKEGFSAILVATGGWDTQLSESSQENPNLPTPGVQLLVDFILKHRAGKKPVSGENVMILGGGKSSLEAANICMEQGAKSVHIIFRNRKESAPFSEVEIEEAEKNSLKFYFETAILKMAGKGEALTDIEIAAISDEGLPESQENLQIDTLLIGSGRFPELIYAPPVIEEQEEGGNESENTDEWETVIPYPSPFAKEDMGIFRPGEATSDYKAVVEAIGAGRRSANSLHRFFSSEPVTAPDKMVRTHTQVLTISEIDPITTIPREKMPEITAEKRINNPLDEIALGYSENQARMEAKRCLQCGLICYRRMDGTIH